MKPQAKSRAKSKSNSFPSNTSPQSSVGTSRKGAHTTFDTVVREGDLITFDPTGEILKIAKIEGDTITIEKFP